MQIFGVLLGILQRNRESDVVLLAFDQDDVFVDNFASSIKVFNEFDNSAFVTEIVGLTVAFVFNLDAYTAVKERKLLKSFDEDIVSIFSIRKDLTIGFEGGFSTSLGCNPRLAHWPGRHAAFVRLSPNFPIAANLHLAPLRQEIDHGDTNTV